MRKITGDALIIIEAKNTLLTHKNNSGNLRERWAFLDSGGNSAFVVEGNTSDLFIIHENIHPSSAVGMVNNT